jgi:hypothetical protein
LRLLLLIFLLSSVAVGQSQPVAKPKPQAAHQKPRAISKPAPTVNFLAGPLDLNTSNLGPNFQGNDISALYHAIKIAPALKEKSEFETTIQFVARRQGFTDKPILGTLTAKDSLAFLLPSEFRFGGPRFEYDADSQTLEFALDGNSMTLFLDSQHPDLDTIRIKSTIIDTGKYMASNAFGAKVEIEKTFSQDNGIAFSKNSWLFRTSPNPYVREFKHLFSMPPEQARTLKQEGRLLLICRLENPWFRETVHGHEAKMDEPYQTTVSDYYLQAVPEQLWIFNQRTGEVLSKLTATVVSDGEDEQLKIKLKQTPLILEVSSARMDICTVSIDEQANKRDVLDNKGPKMFRAQHKIVFKVDNPNSLSGFTFKLNGKTYTPDWQEDSMMIGNNEIIKSATVVITLP